MSLVRTLFVVGLSSFSVLGASVASAAPWGTDKLMNGRSVYGSPDSGQYSGYVVDVRTKKYANIRCGDVVTFVDGDKRFSWKFAVVGHRAVDLQSIAPSGFGAGNLKVYVAPNEAEREG